MLNLPKKYIINIFTAKYGILFLLILIKLILQYAMVNSVYELHRDEFLYLDQAFHPAAGYISVPPFTSWIAAIIHLLGGGLFWVRFFPALFGAMTIVMVWLTVEELKGELSAKTIASILLIFSPFSRLNVLFQPNAFDILVWTVIFFALIKFFHTRNNKWLLLLGVVCALAIYNKYTTLFLLVGLFIGLFISSQRKIFVNKYFYLTMGICLALVLPNIIWQISSNFPVIHHMKALNEKQLVNNSYTGFLIAQPVFLMFGTLMVLAALWSFIFYKPFQKYRFIGFTFRIVIALFTFAKAKSYYALGLYPVLMAFGSAYLERVVKKGKMLFFNLLGAISIAAFLYIGPFIMPYHSPEYIADNQEMYEKMGLLNWEDGSKRKLPQDFANMTGWKEVAAKALDIYGQMPGKEKSHTLVLCNNYGLAGAVNYYNRGEMGEAYSLDTDYIFWIPDYPVIQNIIWIGPKPDSETLELFNTVQVKGTIENKYAEEFGTQIYLLSQPKTDITPVFYKMIEEKKRTMDIF